MYLSTSFRGIGRRISTDIYLTKLSCYSSSLGFHQVLLSSYHSETSRDPIPLPIKAYYITEEIDLKNIKHVYRENKIDTRQKSIIVNLASKENQFISFFNYGSVVFINVPEEEHQQYLKPLQDSSTSLLHSENYKMTLWPDLHKLSVFEKPDKLKIRSMDSTILEIISTVMAQTVAFEYCEERVSKLFDLFTSINSTLTTTSGQGESSGTLKKRFDDENNYKTLISINRLITTLIYKMGIFETADAAWEDHDNWATWEALRREFEIEKRFEEITVKTNIISENTRFFLELHHNKQSLSTEYIIILLICIEIVFEVIEFTRSLGL